MLQTLNWQTRDSIAKSFHPFGLEHAISINLEHDPFPTHVTAWNGAAIDLAAGGTQFGFVQAGLTELECESGRFELTAGMYFAIPGHARIVGGSGLAIMRIGYRGFFHIGGPIEDTGRLRYIDGCTDSLLIPPVLRDDPCLNLLHIPPGTRQTAHTHPSIRVGLVVRGSGACVTATERFPLRPGLGFIIAAELLHSFHTEDRSLLVIAYHPDSDFGPTHECHPMRNRTILPVAEKRP